MGMKNRMPQICRIMYEKMMPGDVVLHTTPSGKSSTIRQPRTIKIDKYLEKYKTFEYIYDFGDYWRHKIELEKILGI